jgi:hypothetical protein
MLKMEHLQQQQQQHSWSTAGLTATYTEQKFAVNGFLVQVTATGGDALCQCF